MRNTFSKRIFAVLAAVLLGAALCAPLTFADEADTADTTDSTETVDTTEGTTDTAGEDSSGAESFFNELKADNGVGRTLFIAGAVCIVLGVGIYREYGSKKTAPSPEASTGQASKSADAEKIDSADTGSGGKNS